MLGFASVNTGRQKDLWIKWIQLMGSQWWRGPGAYYPAVPEASHQIPACPQRAAGLSDFGAAISMPFLSVPLRTRSTLYAVHVLASHTCLQDGSIAVVVVEVTVDSVLFMGQ